jgi:multiple sugar transport system ATP-binding protein
MDEPLSNLDAKLRVYMRSELKRLQKDLEVTTIYVTHDQVEALSMADKVAIMNQGALQQLGDAYEVFNHPANVFVASFIGSPSMNLLDCTFTEKNGSCILDAGAFTLSIPDDIGKIVKENATSSKLVLGIRPEDISLGKKRTPEKFIKSEIYVTEPLGSEVLVSLKVEDNLVKAKIIPDSEMRLGEKLWMGLNKEKMHLFDKISEKVII